MSYWWSMLTLDCLRFPLSFKFIWVMKDVGYDWDTFAVFIVFILSVIFLSSKYSNKFSYMVTDLVYLISFFGYILSADNGHYINLCFPFFLSFHPSSSTIIFHHLAITKPSTHATSKKTTVSLWSLLMADISLPPSSSYSSPTYESSDSEIDHDVGVQQAIIASQFETPKAQGTQQFGLKRPASPITPIK